jgi:hypothetical protein
VQSTQVLKETDQVSVVMSLSEAINFATVIGMSGGGCLFGAKAVQLAIQYPALRRTCISRLHVRLDGHVQSTSPIHVKAVAQCPNNQVMFESEPSQWNQNGRDIILFTQSQPKTVDLKIGNTYRLSGSLLTMSSLSRVGTPAVRYLQLVDKDALFDPSESDVKQLFWDSIIFILLWLCLAWCFLSIGFKLYCDLPR